MKAELKKVFKAFSIELPIYAILMVAYVLLVLHFLGAWLFQLFTAERKLYAVVALVLIVAQGYVLELIARGLLVLIQGKKGK